MHGTATHEGCAMLGMIFGLNARIGRLKFFFGSIVLGIVTTILAFFVAYSLYHAAASGRVPHSLGEAGWPALALAGFYLVATFMLTSMRIRDIGWDPVCIVSAWIALSALDYALASKLPDLSLEPRHHGTIIGGLVNLAVVLVLTFWPGSGQPSESSASGGWTPRSRDRAGGAVPADRIASVTGQLGRRG